MACRLGNIRFEMTLTRGTRLGSYIIDGPLGAGGMGEVYRARDPRLQREVAIKVLPELLASDRDRRERFEREAQLLAAFNHPHIAQIYGTVDTNNGGGAIVMELVDGATLSDRIAQGPVPPADAVAVASQLVDAVDAAHSRGTTSFHMRMGVRQQSRISSSGAHNRYEAQQCFGLFVRELGRAIDLSAESMRLSATDESVKRQPAVCMIDSTHVGNSSPEPSFSIRQQPLHD